MAHLKGVEGLREIMPIVRRIHATFEAGCCLNALPQMLATLSFHCLHVSKPGVPGLSLSLSLSLSLHLLSPSRASLSSSSLSSIFLLPIPEYGRWLMRLFRSGGRGRCRVGSRYLPISPSPMDEATLCFTRSPESRRAMGRGLSRRGGCCHRYSQRGFRISLALSLSLLSAP